MGRTLQLVSPHMTGQDVKDLQHLLVEGGYLASAPDAEDGEYGPLTAQAVYRAKFRLGYPKPDQAAADILVSYLTGKKKPTPAMIAESAKRAKSDNTKERKLQDASGLTRGQLIVQKAASQLGQTEDPPGSDKSKFSTWYGMIGHWCAMYVTWVFCDLGYSAATFKKGARYAYVPYVVHDAKAGLNGLMLAPGPSDGTVVCFDWNRDGTADHIGICADEATLRRLVPAALDAAIKAFGPLGSGDFWTVEGNTAVGNDSNGGMVLLRKRNRSLVAAFVKVAA